MWIRRRQTDYALCGCNHSISSYHEFKSGGGIKVKLHYEVLQPPPPKKKNCHLKQIAEKKVGDIFFLGGVIWFSWDFFLAHVGARSPSCHVWFRHSTPWAPLRNTGCPWVRWKPCQLCGVARWGCTKRRGKIDESEGFFWRISMKHELPSRKLTYPTWGKGKSSSNMPYQGDMLIPWRV